MKVYFETKYWKDPLKALMAVKGKDRYNFIFFRLENEEKGVFIATDGLIAVRLSGPIYIEEYEEIKPLFLSIDSRMLNEILNSYSFIMEIGEKVYLKGLAISYEVITEERKLDMDFPFNRFKNSNADGEVQYGICIDSVIVLAEFFKKAKITSSYVFPEFDLKYEAMRIVIDEFIKIEVIAMLNKKIKVEGTL